MKDILFKDESYRIIGACFEVHSIIGCGFKERIYQSALEIELSKRKIPTKREKKIDVYYKNIRIKPGFRPDFICFGKIIVELKALSELEPRHEAQILNYLKASGLQVGYLINFGTESLYYKRYIKAGKWKPKENTYKEIPY